MIAVFARLRAESMSVTRCSVCGAEIGEVCRNLASGDPLHTLPAHTVRMWDAGVMARPTKREENRDAA